MYIYILTDLVGHWLGPNGARKHKNEKKNDKYHNISIDSDPIHLKLWHFMYFCVLNPEIIHTLAYNSYFFI